MALTSSEVVPHCAVAPHSGLRQLGWQQALRPHEKSGSLFTPQGGHFHAQVFPAPSSITRFPLHTPQCGQAGEYAPRPYVSSLTPGFNFFFPAIIRAFEPASQPDIAIHFFPLAFGGRPIGSVPGFMSQFGVLQPAQSFGRLSVRLTHLCPQCRH